MRCACRHINFITRWATALWQEGYQKQLGLVWPVIRSLHRKLKNPQSFQHASRQFSCLWSQWCILLSETMPSRHSPCLLFGMLSSSLWYVFICLYKRPKPWRGMNLIIFLKLKWKMFCNYFNWFCLRSNRMICKTHFRLKADQPWKTLGRECRTLW